MEHTSSEKDAVQVGDGGDVVDETDVHEDHWEDKAFASLVAEQNRSGIDTELDVVCGILTGN